MNFREWAMLYGVNQSKGGSKEVIGLKKSDEPNEP